MPTGFYAYPITWADGSYGEIRITKRPFRERWESTRLWPWRDRLDEIVRGRWCVADWSVEMGTVSIMSFARRSRAVERAKYLSASFPPILEHQP